MPSLALRALTIVSCLPAAYLQRNALALPDLSRASTNEIRRREDKIRMSRSARGDDPLGNKVRRLNNQFLAATGSIDRDHANSHELDNRVRGVIARAIDTSKDGNHAGLPDNRSQLILDAGAY